MEASKRSLPPEDPYAAKVHDLAADLINLVRETLETLPVSGFGIDQVTRGSEGIVVAFSGQNYHGDVRRTHTDPIGTWRGSWAFNDATKA